MITKLKLSALGGLSVLAISLLVTSTIAAQEEPPMERPLPHHADLTPEQKAQMRERMEAHGMEKAQRHLDEIDQNGDGKVDLNEFLSNAETRFTEMDTDSDGYVTAAEAKSRYKALRKKFRENRKHFRKNRFGEKASEAESAVENQE